MISNWVKDGIKNRTGPDLRPYVNQAFKVFILSNPDYRPVGYLDRFLLEAIQSIAGEMLSVKREGLAEAHKNVRSRSEYSVDNLLRSRKALEGILPDVEELRREVFGKNAAPFKSGTAALRWLAKEGREEAVSFYKEKGDTRQRVKALETKIVRLLDERNDLAEGLWLLNMHFVEPVPLGGYYRTYPGTKLRTLVAKVKILAGVSKFQEQSLYAFILTGVKPIRRLMDITFIGPVTIRDLLDYYKRLPPEYKNSRKMTSICNAVYEFIHELGGPPKKKVMKFWREATKVWNKQRGHRKYDSRDGLKKAYERALKKLPS